MPKCIVDTTSSRTFQKNLKLLKKKYPKVESDLRAAIVEVQADYSRACNAFCVPMPNQPAYQRRVFKYDWKSTDIGKHPRECFRLICAFIDEPSDGSTMYALLAYYKGDRSNILPKEIASEVKALKASLDSTHIPEVAE